MNLLSEELQPMYSTASPVHTRLTNNIVKKRIQPSGKKKCNIPGNANERNDTPITFATTFLMNEVEEKASTIRVKKNSRNNKQHNATDIATADTLSGARDAFKQRYDNGKFIISIPPTTN